MIISYHFHFHFTKIHDCLKLLKNNNIFTILFDIIHLRYFLYDIDDASQQWREASYTNSHGDVQRVYTVCNVAVTSVDNWLRTPYIPAGDSNRLYVDVRFSMRKCTKYPDPVRLQQCKESFKLLHFDADTDLADSSTPTWDEETYRHVDVIAADRVFMDINQVRHISDGS